MPILKIIGIAILCLLAAAMLIVLIVLFWPIRYRAAGTYDDGGALIEGKAKWFFGLASIDIRYENGQPLAAKARLFFITIFDLQKIGGSGSRLRRRKRRKDWAEEAEFSAEIQAADISSGENNAAMEDALEKSDAKEAGIKEADAKESDVKEADVSESDAKETDAKDADIKEADVREPDETADDAGQTGFFRKIKKFFEKLARFIDNIEFTFHKICAIIVKVRDNARYYRELLQEESTKQALGLCKKQLLKIWKNSSPRKYEAKLHLGFDDPSVMGNVLALWGMLYPFHLGRIDIIPEFDRRIIEGSFKLAGRISVYVFLRAAWIFMADKNIKQLKVKLGI